MSNCRFCRAPLVDSVVDLGMSPISNEFIPEHRHNAAEVFYPLHAYVCSSCKLVQLVDYEKADVLFRDDYAYFSSFSSSWLAHAKEYACAVIEREGLGPNSMVVEVASNDGYLLKNFKAAGIPVLGVEPTANTAAAALEHHGVESEVAFFGRETALRLRDRGILADVMVANNVLAHVPDINDFVSGYKILLKTTGVANFEFPHLLRLIEDIQFDTIYHEHFSYLSLAAVSRIFEAHGLRVYDVEELPTHGGSLRIYVAHIESDRQPTPRVEQVLAREERFGLNDVSTYRSFAASVMDTKMSTLRFFMECREQGKTVAGYGAPAKGNTLLNYCGVKEDMLPFTVDRNPHKIGKRLPGSHIPIYDPSAISEYKPDYVLILPWNLRDEVMEYLSFIREWGGKFVTAIPSIRVFE